MEAALLEHEVVDMAGVVGVQSPLHGENVRAFVTLAEGASRPTMQDLIQFARTRVGYKAPRESSSWMRCPSTRRARWTA